MAYAARSIIFRDPDMPLCTAHAGPQKIVSGWVGLYGPTDNELRLVCVLLPGDVIVGHRGCVIQALTAVQLEPSLRSQSVDDILFRQCFRLSQYSAIPRVTDFLIDIYRRLSAAGHASDRNYALPLTQQQLGELLGMSTVHISRTLKAIRPAIRVSHHQVHIEQSEKVAEVRRCDSIAAMN